MKTSVQQWGNSLALRIPKAFAEQLKVRKGTRVSVAVEDGRLVVEAPKYRKYSLQELVSKITAKNRHEETEWGPPQDKEIW